MVLHISIPQTKFSSLVVFVVQEFFFGWYGSIFLEKLVGFLGFVGGAIIGGRNLLVVCGTLLFSHSS